MFDFVRNLRKSAEEKQQELLTAYIDDTLSAAERQRFEAQMGRDEALAAQVRQQRLIKQRLSGMPRRRVPHSFALDPAVYGKPTPRPLFRLYPALQTATVLAALMLMFLVGLELFGGGSQSANVEAPVAMVEQAAETAVLPEAAAPAAEAYPAETMAFEAAPAEAPAEEALAADAPAPAEDEMATANEVPLEEPVTGFAAPTATDGAEVLPTVGSVPREAEEEMRAVVVETAVATAESLPQSDAVEGVAAVTPTPEGVETAVGPAPTPSPWRGWQIGLAIAFVVLLLLTLAVRQRLR